MNAALIALGWAVVGAAAGWVVRWGSVRLARLEELEPGAKPWQVYGPPIMSAILFALFAYGQSSFPLLVVQSVFVLILMQIIFFDFEHRLILDRVLFPSMGLAFVASLFGKPWWPGTALFGRPWLEAIATGLAAGLLFFVLALLGQAIFKADALGFGDVKFAVFMGLLLGPLPTAQALFYGVVLAGVAAVGVIIRHRSTKGTLAYGPYLAAGVLIVLYQLR